MQMLQSPPRDNRMVVVTLEPGLAREVARALQIQLASALDRPLDEPLPNREDTGRLRTVLDLCVEQLDALGWGEPGGDVRMTAPQLLLETIAEDLLDGGNERLTHPLGWNSPGEPSVLRQGHLMIRAASVIGGALAAGDELTA